MKNRVDVLHGSIMQGLLFLMMPILVCGIFQTLYSMVDAIVVGKYVGSVGVATIGGSCNSLISFYTGITSNIILGCMTVVAFLYGAKEGKKDSGVLTSLYIAVSVGAGFCFVYNLFAKDILLAVHVPDNLIESSVIYLKTYSLGFVPYFVFQLIVNLLRAFGETKKPTYLLTSSFVVNIILDYVFVGILKLEQNGIAYAYIVTQILYAGLSVYTLMHIDFLHLRKELPQLDILIKILKIAVPACVASFFYSFTNLMVSSSMNQLGANTIAAFAIHNKIENMYWVVMNGFGVAITTVISQNYGAKLIDRVKEGIKSGMVLCFGLTIGICLFYFLGNKVLVSLFINEKEISELACAILKHMTPFFLTYPILEVLSDTLKCLDKAVQSTCITLISICGIRCAWILLYVNEHLSFQNVLYAYPLSWAVASTLFLIYYLGVRSKLLKE